MIEYPIKKKYITWLNSEETKMKQNSNKKQQNIYSVIYEKINTLQWFKCIGSTGNVIARAWINNNVKIEIEDRIHNSRQYFTKANEPSKLYITVTDGDGKLIVISVRKGDALFKKAQKIYNDIQVDIIEEEKKEQRMEKLLTYLRNV